MCHSPHFDMNVKLKDKIHELVKKILISCETRHVENVKKIYARSTRSLFIDFVCLLHPCLDAE